VSEVSHNSPVYHRWQSGEIATQGCDDIMIRDSFHPTGFWCIMYWFCFGLFQCQYPTQQRSIRQGMKLQNVCRSADQTGDSRKEELKRLVRVLDYMVALYLDRIPKSSPKFNLQANQEQTEPNMKSALVIQCVLLPATLASLLTVHLVMPPDNNVTVTGKKQSSDEAPVEMSQIPGDKVVCLSDDNQWVQYCADRETVNYIDQISFEEKTKDPRPMVINRAHGIATVSSIPY
jgi:hypothetical protein